MKRVLSLLIAAVMLALAGASAPAIASVHHHHAIGGGPFTIKEEFGSQYVGASSLAAGNMVVTVSSSNSRLLTFVHQTTYLGDDAGLWQFTSGNYMATTASCAVTIKSDSSSNGTIWAVHFSGGHMYLVNRFCDVDGNDTANLAALNSAGHQWQGNINPSEVVGYFAKLVLGAF